MNTITGPGPTVSPITPPTGPVPTTTSPQQSAEPLYLSSFTAQSTAYVLGLASPRNLGDLEAVFAEIATKLAETRGENADFAKAAETSSQSSLLRRIALNFLVFLKVGDTIVEEGANIVKQTKIIAEKTAELAVLNETLEGLESSRDAKVSQRDGNIATIVEKGLEIAGLGIELAAVETARAIACGIDSGSDACADLTATANSLNSQIDGLEADIDTLNGQNAVLNAEIDDLNDQIDVVNDQIDVVKDEIQAAKDSKAESEEKLEAATNQYYFLLGTLVPFTISLALNARQKSKQDSFDVFPVQTDLDQALKSAVEEIVNRELRQTDRTYNRTFVQNITSQNPVSGAGATGAIAARNGTGAQNPPNGVRPPVQPLADTAPDTTPPTDTPVARDTPDPAPARDEGTPKPPPNETQSARADRPPQPGGEPVQPATVPIQPDLPDPRPLGVFSDEAKTLLEAFDDELLDPDAVLNRASSFLSTVSLFFSSLRSLSTAPPQQVPQEFTPAGRFNLPI